ncbi:peptide ABC transporter ATP-binding protein [Candidatus Aerophobetes bacterium Ae_b3a]|nr:MAG: peptide ABC transporter ATP-binding protein [Candidatus Aerophobetes bacterium Ae_b3a]
MDKQNEILLEVKNLKKYFPITRGVFRRVVGYVKAVDRVDLFIRQGETLGLVGESGCGKTTLGRSILRLIEPTDGEVWFKTGKGKKLDITKLEDREIKSLRREMRMIFQDPYASLNPRMTVMDIVGEPLIIHKVAQGKEIEDRVRTLLKIVGLNPRYMRRYPHEFSGGQRQRIGIARALALNPRLVIADEPVSALDVSVQAQVINLLENLQVQFNLTYLFIAHDLSVVYHISNRIAVMYVGKIMEVGQAEEVYQGPRHPYTEALMSAVPVIDPDVKPERILLQGDVPNPANSPSGCTFHPRCRYAKKICSQEEPPLEDIGDEHYVACHFADDFSLKGIRQF